MVLKSDKPELESADTLIAEALKAVEAREEKTQKERSDEIVLKSKEVPEEEKEETKEKEERSQTIGQVDSKQFIDRESYLRLAADFENFRRRAAREREEAEKSGRERTLRGFLEILDNIERALQQVQGDESPITQGLRLILSQSETWLKVEGCERIESKGTIFDPTIHEAIAQIESEEFATGLVTEEIKRGYKWWGRLLRPAHVVVSKGPATHGEETKESLEDSGSEESKSINQGD